MMASEFESKLKKLNPNFRIDWEHRTHPEHPDFPASGLYHNGKFVMGVSQGEMYKESVWGVNLEKLEMEDISNLPEVGSWLDNDWVEYHQKYNTDKVDDRIVARGYAFILSELTRLKYIQQNEAESLFNVHLCPEKPEATYPRKYLGLNFEGE